MYEEATKGNAHVDRDCHGSGFDSSGDIHDLCVVTAMIEQELERIWWDDGDISIAQDDVISITLKNDGNGLSGGYDRIHVFSANPRWMHRVFPAHHVHGWIVKRGEE